MIGAIESTIPGAMVFLIPIVGSVALFTFLAVSSYAEERRKEREAYYRYDFQKKLLETGGTPEQIGALLLQQDEARTGRDTEGRKLGGLVTMAIGFGLLFGLRFVGDAVWMIGYVPIAIGGAITLYAFLLAPRRSTGARVPGGAGAGMGMGAPGHPGEAPRACARGRRGPANSSPDPWPGCPMARLPLPSPANGGMLPPCPPSCRFAPSGRRRAASRSPSACRRRTM